MNLIPKIKPIGIGNLEVVKQQLDGYEDGEIAHIENIMANEYRKRSHRKLRQLEEFRSFEEDRSTESSNHLESTERFELEKEIQRTIKSETKFEAGVEVSGGFGPVKFSAHAGFSTSSSSEEIQKESSNYAKEIIQKSVEKIKDRVKQSKTTRILEEFEERNEHGFDNVGNGHVVGEYKWQNKVYKTKVETLGKRLFYEFIIPQPSMNYLYKESHNSLHLETPIAPSFPKIVQEGRLDAISGDPAVSVIQLAELLAERDQYIKAGTFVLAGAATAAVALEPGMEVSLSVEGLSDMSVNIEE